MCAVHAFIIEERLLITAQKAFRQCNLRVGVASIYICIYADQNIQDVEIIFGANSWNNTDGRGLNQLRA